MATITARKNKDGIITSYTIRVLLYEDGKGKHYETSSFKINPEWKEKTARKKAEAYAAFVSSNINPFTNLTRMGTRFQNDLARVLDNVFR